MRKVAAALLMGLAALAAASQGAAAESIVQPIEFAEDIPIGIVYSVSISVPEEQWSTLHFDLNFTATQPIDAFLMRCGEADRFQNGQESVFLTAAVGKVGRLNATVASQTYGDPDVCLVLDHTSLGEARPGPSDPPVNVSVSGSVVAQLGDGTFDAGPGGGSPLAAGLPAFTAIAGLFSTLYLIGHHGQNFMAPQSPLKRKKGAQPPVRP